MNLIERGLLQNRSIFIEDDLCFCEISCDDWQFGNEFLLGVFLIRWIALFLSSVEQGILDELCIYSSFINLKISLLEIV
jgi:hypothetical protein